MRYYERTRLRLSTPLSAMGKADRAVSVGIFAASYAMAFSFDCRNTWQAKRAGNAMAGDINITVHLDSDRFRRMAPGTLMDTATLRIHSLEISNRNSCIEGKQRLTRNKAVHRTAEPWII